ncbi:MAG: lipopolysaccharide heptosyltransferase II [Deltaproteobacteria bacterium]|nr:lipopolysaccharide heptosyltransferase II [Deltaproteobacteria bacterium]
MTPVEPARVLVKAVNWLGDLVISLPALKAVRRAFPQAHLAVLVKRELASFFDGSSWVDEVIPYALAAGLRGLGDRRRIIAGIRARAFGLAVILPKSFDAALWPAAGGVARRAGFASDARGWLLTDKVRLTPALLETHQVHLYLHMIRAALGIAGSATDYAPDVGEHNRAKMAAWLGEQRRRPRAALIALAVAAAYGPAKEWPSECFAELIDLLAERGQAECVLVGSPAERAKCEAVAAASRHGALVAAGTTNVGEAMALLSLCDGFAGNDSGSMHVAGALGIPTVGLFGSTNYERTGPLGPKAKAIYHQIECSPCLQRTCRFGHYRCLREIRPAEVAAALHDAGAPLHFSGVASPSPGGTV